MIKKRPKHLALHQIKLPLPGIVSILHRASGAALFLALPILLWMLQSSLRSIETYTALMDVLAHPITKVLVLGLSWSFVHHFCAGLRFLAIDLHWIGDLQSARNSSWAVMGASVVLTLLIGVQLW